MLQLTPTPQEVQVRSAVQHIATFAASARPEHFKSNIRQLYKRNILDSLGCAIAGLQGRPFQALREQFEEYRASGRCTLIGGGKTSADQAALFNSSLVRYVDLLEIDRYHRAIVSPPCFWSDRKCVSHRNQSKMQAILLRRTHRDFRKTVVHRQNPCRG